MRTTVTLDDQLFEEAKILAVKRRTSLRSILEEALRRLLDAQADAPPQPVSLPVFAGSGTLPGVDLADKHGLADLMDGVQQRADA